MSDSSRLILASASPRRALLLRQVGVEFSVAAQNIDETGRPDESADDYVMRMAREKTDACLGRQSTGQWVLGADTAVVCNDDILGKPEDHAQATAMLGMLNGVVHRVVSAICLARADDIHQAISVSRVTLQFPDQTALNAYVRSGEGQDKAGAYAIQGRAGAFVAHLEGSYSGVMGLPLFETCTLLRRAGMAQ